MTTGANRDGWHVRGVDLTRDASVDKWADLREVTEGEACISCGRPLLMVPTIEAGHIFKLGRKYSEVFGAMVLDEKGARVPIVMGSYGIGSERNLATIVETHHDDKGIIWPVTVAPYEVVVSVVRMDVLLDDRDIRAGVKFADAELIGIPWRVTIGPKGLANELAELTCRSTMATREELLVDVATVVMNEVVSARA